MVRARTSSLLDIARRSSCASREGRPPAGERSECEPIPLNFTRTRHTAATDRSVRSRMPACVSTTMVIPASPPDEWDRRTARRRNPSCESRRA